jgi:hypothetical protein
MNEVSIISACPKCGGMPIVIERIWKSRFLNETELYEVVCEDCHDRGDSALSPERAIENWKAHCKQETRSR